MKKIIIYVMTFALALSLLACGRPNSANPTQPIQPTQPLQPNSTPQSTTPTPEAVLPAYPVIDGSTSTITMHAAIRAHLTGVYMKPKHSKTYTSIERLVPGSENPADIVLAVKYNDKTMQELKEKGADLVSAPIAKEGFVFLLHKDNPVNSLSAQQLKDIYSAKITNWKEVGGKDEAIVLFTRNQDSGSQTAMEDFMGGPLSEGAHVIGTMGDMLSSIQETGSAGIGYNIYTWSLGQGLDEMRLKTVAVDGIAPSNKTLADDSYPLRVYTYSYYNRGNEKGQALADWLLSDDGQRVIAGAGYVSMNGEQPPEQPIDFDKDTTLSMETALAYSKQSGWGEDLYPEERIDDTAQIAALANGKEKYLTVLWLMGGTVKKEGESTKGLQYVVLTREKDGAFEVINAGEVLEYDYETGKMTVAPSEANG